MNKHDDMSLDDKMDFWLKNNLNVLLTGTQGVGKSALIENTVKRNGIQNYKYFTASLMDPYLTLIGVPKEGKTDNGESFLDFIVPKEMQDDSVEFIFLDEFNRAPQAVRNAVMELIQFKSINGRRLKNLKAVWAAINPYDDNETFNVFELDPAQKDRFHVQYTIPCEPSAEYFTSKFGNHMAKTAIKWWNAVPEDIRSEISPRRLDYGLEMYQMGGDVRDVLHELSRPETLIRQLEDLTGGEGSSMDRWMSDPESFLEEIINRNVKYEGDVVADFKELKKLMLDQAVDYVGKLLPEQLGLLKDDSATVELLLRNIAGPCNDTVETSLKESAWHPQHNQFIFDSAKQKTSAKFFKALEAEDFDAMEKHAKSGLELMITIMYAEKTEGVAKPLPERYKECYELKPALLKYLAMCDYNRASEMFKAPV